MMVYRVFQSNIDEADTEVGLFTDENVAARAAEMFRGDYLSVELDRNAQAILCGQLPWLVRVSRDPLEVPEAERSHGVPMDCVDGQDIDGRAIVTLWATDPKSAQRRAIELVRAEELRCMKAGEVFWKPARPQDKATLEAIDAVLDHMVPPSPESIAEVFNVSHGAEATAPASMTPPTGNGGGAPVDSVTGDAPATPPVKRGPGRPRKVTTDEVKP